MVADGFSACVELVDQWEARGNVDARNGLSTDAIKRHHDAPQTVAVGKHQDVLSGLEFGEDFRLLIRFGSGHREL